MSESSWTVMLTRVANWAAWDVAAVEKLAFEVMDTLMFSSVGSTWINSATRRRNSTSSKIGEPFFARGTLRIDQKPKLW